MTDQHVQQNISKMKRISQLFILWNSIFFIVSLVVRNSIASDAVGSVFLRGGFYAAGGLILIYLLNDMSKGKRSGWLRLSIISVLAPIGVLAFIIFTPHLPVWFIIGQIGSGLMCAALASILLRKDVRTYFSKEMVAARTQTTR
jgi:hypothetical protein